jgi:hypothetical protein
MSVNKTWNGVVYSIPNTRSESGWETTLSSYLQALADNAATTTFNKQAVRKATTTPVTVSASTDCTIIVDLTGPGASTVNLPAGADKQIFIIVDGKGDASTNNITIDANGSETIEGSLTKVIRSNRECLALQYSSSAGDWKVIGGYVPNMIGGPGSAVDNAIARFDGTTGKLVQNSGVTIDDINTVRLLGVSGSPIYTRFDNLVNAGKVWRSGNTGGVSVSTFDIYNETDNIVALSAASSGAVTLGPSSSDAINHRINGSVGLSSTLAMNSSQFRFVGSDNGGMMLGYSTGSTYLMGGGYYNGTSYIAKNANAALVGFRAAPITSDSDVAFEWYKNTDGDYTFSAGATLGTQIILSSMTAAGAWTLGPSGADGVDHLIRGTTKLYRANATATSYLFYAHSNVGGTDLLKWRVECDGDTISSTGSYTSDLRAKKDVAPIHYGLNEILQLDPMSFRWNHDDANEAKSFSLGSAQLIQSIMPEMVRDDGLEHVDFEGNKFQAKSIYGQEVVAVMVKAIQELKAELDVAKARIEALENP